MSRIAISHCFIKDWENVGAKLNLGTVTFVTIQSEPRASASGNFRSLTVAARTLQVWKQASEASIDTGWSCGTMNASAGALDASGVQRVWQAG